MILWRKKNHWWDFRLLNISKNEYEWALSISDEDNLQIHTEQPPNSCFVSSHFSEGLQAWNVNIDIQSVFDSYKAMAYMCAYLSKSEDERSQIMKHLVQDAVETKFQIYD